MSKPLREYSVSAIERGENVRLKLVEQVLDRIKDLPYQNQPWARVLVAEALDTELSARWWIEREFVDPVEVFGLILDYEWVRIWEPEIDEWAG